MNKEKYDEESLKEELQPVVELCLLAYKIEKEHQKQGKPSALDKIPSIPQKLKQTNSEIPENGLNSENAVTKPKRKYQKWTKTKDEGFLLGLA